MALAKFSYTADADVTGACVSLSPDIPVVAAGRCAGGDGRYENLSPSLRGGDAVAELRCSVVSLATISSVMLIYICKIYSMTDTTTELHDNKNDPGETYFPIP